MNNETNFCQGGCGSPLPENILDEIRFGRDNLPENTGPYDEDKLIEGAEVFVENHPFTLMLEQVRL
ncbi:MAG: hypothetical protein IJU79_01810 [Desulfovibrionaceae bacterium]|nr:hypothetical protein [Desulfovibrionaceae bacterium]